MTIKIGIVQALWALLRAFALKRCQISDLLRLSVLKPQRHVFHVFEY